MWYNKQALDLAVESLETLASLGNMKIAVTYSGVASMAKSTLSKSQRRKKNRDRRQRNKDLIEDSKKVCARYVGLPVEKYSPLELVICVAAKFEEPVSGKHHPHDQVKYWASRIRRRESSSPDTVVRSTKKDFMQSRSWQILRYQAFERHGNFCACCGASPSDGVTMHVDHIKPKSTHPELALDLDNLQILCADCNIGKINQWDTNWMDYHK